MPPIIGKLICNNKDALQQRNEDTDSMIDMILRKRNDSTFEKHLDTGNIRKSLHTDGQTDELLKIAETIRDLAEKLHTQQSRSIISEPTVSARQETFDAHQTQNCSNGKTQVSDLIHQNLLDAITKLRQCQDNESFPEYTPKAGNLTLLEEKTPIHSNLSRKKYCGKDGFSGFGSPNASSYETSFSRDSGKIEESLAQLRSNLSKAKRVSKTNAGNNGNCSNTNHPLSTKNTVATCNKVGFEKHDRRNAIGVEGIGQKVSKDINIKEMWASLPLQKRRSLSAGAAQSGLHLFNRIVRGYEKESGLAEQLQSLKKSPSDTTPDTVRLSGSKSSVLSEESEIVVNHHYLTSKYENDPVSKPIELIRVNEKRRGMYQRSSTPTPRARSASREKSRQNSVQLLHGSDTHSHHVKNKSNSLATAGPAISFSSPKSDFLSPQQNRQPVKYKPIRNDSEKGFEIFLTDASKEVQKNKSVTGEYNVRSKHEVSTSREVMKDRVKSQRQAIERLQQELYASSGIIPERKINLKTTAYNSSGVSIDLSNKYHQDAFSLSKQSSEKRKPTRSVIRE